MQWLILSFICFTGLLAPHVGHVRFLLGEGPRGLHVHDGFVCITERYAVDDVLRALDIDGDEFDFYVDGE